MEKTVDTIINSYDDLIFALQNRIDYFDQHGCKSSDHGINVMYYERVTDKEVRDIFKKRMKKEILTNKELNKFKTHLLVSLGEMYADKNWDMQLHIGPLRNNNSKMFNKLGADSGFDSMDDQSLAEPLSKFLNELAKKDKLPKTVLYSLNQNDYYVLAAMAGNFQNDEIPGKVQFGTAWWFNDQI